MTRPVLQPNPALKTSERPLVSICLPTLNAIEFLQQRTDSILSQTVRDWELIVCDSYSDDGTWEYLSKLASDARVRLYQVPKEGLYAGWNECLRRVRGEFVYVATADDTMYPRCLEILAAPLLANPDVDMVMTEVDEIDVNDQILPRPQPRIWKYLGAALQGRPGRVSRETFALLLAGFPLGIGSITGVLIRRRLLEKSGLYPTDLSYLGDAEWALRAALASDVIALPDRVATWRIRPGQASRKFDLGQSLIFRKALERVLDDPQSGVPDHWKQVPGWRKRVLGPRSWAAVEYSGLLRMNLRRNAHLFPRRLMNTWRRDRALFWERVTSLFALPAGLRRDYETIVSELLKDFHAEWPPRIVEIPADQTASPAQATSSVSHSSSW